MSGHQPPVGHGAFAEAVSPVRPSKGQLPHRPPAARAYGGQPWRLHPELTARPTTRTTSGPCPPPQPAGIQHVLAGKGGMPAGPSEHDPQAHRPAKEPTVRNPTLWQIDMGGGTWAVSCRTCRLTYRGPKAGADLLFDTHLCEPVVPLREQTR
jgi:hypothetical protein